MNRKEGQFVNKPRLFLCAHIRRSKGPHKTERIMGVNKEHGFGWLGLSPIFGRAESKGKPCLLPSL